MYHVSKIITQIDPCFVLSLQTFIHHLCLWGSIIISFLWFAIYGVLENIFWDMYYVPLVTMATSEFWSVCALSAVLALFPRYRVCLFACVPILPCCNLGDIGCGQYSVLVQCTD